MDAAKREKNQSAFRRLERSIQEKYAPAQFLAIFDSKIVADGSTFDEVQSMLKRLGINPPDVLIVQAGVDYPEHTVVFAEASRR